MKIKDIKVGNYVLSRNPNGKLEYKKVVNTFDNGKQTVYEFTLKSGNKIVSTFDHKVLTEFDTFEPIGAVKNIKTVDGLDEIVERKQLNNQKVYDIEVQDNHNFFVNGCEVSNCRAGAQTPFSSINYGTGTTTEQRMIIKYILKATDEGLGHGETAIFPVQIFRLKKGINMEKGEPNYDLFQYACAVSAKRLFPNFSFQDVPFNLQYYKEGHPETEIAVMGCRTRVIGNVLKNNEIYVGRGNFSFTTINLPRLGIEAKGDWDKFYKDFDHMIDLAKDQLLDRFEMISHKHVYNYPFLMQQGVWIDSDNLDLNDEIGEVLKNASISIGFIGLAECLKAMMGKHHGESEEAYQKGLEIIQHLRAKTDGFTKQYNLNFSTFASPAEGLCLAGDTLVQTSNGNVPIKDVKVGDYVLTMNEQTHEIEPRLVLKSQKTFEHAKVMKLSFENEKFIICTPNHPIMKSDYSWSRADELKINDEILGINPHNLMFKNSKLEKIECLDDEISVYDLTIDVNHNFFLGNGILVHNSGRFTRLDKKRYGIIEGVTDREYYTNSFHIPVYFKIPAYKKMQLEGKFHELCNAGAITYIEMDGNLTKNVQAFEDIVKYAGECGISYFSINHAVDRCPICGYTGIIGDECPRCGFREGVGVSLEQLKKRGLEKLCCLKGI